MFRNDVILGERLCNMRTAVRLTSDLRVAQSQGVAVLVFARPKLARRFWLREIDVIPIRDDTGPSECEFEEQLVGDLTELGSVVEQVLVAGDVLARFEQITLADDPTVQPVFNLIRAKM